MLAHAPDNFPWKMPPLLMIFFDLDYRSILGIWHMSIFSHHVATRPASGREVGPVPYFGCAEKIWWIVVTILNCIPRTIYAPRPSALRTKHWDRLTDFWPWTSPPNDGTYHRKAYWMIETRWLGRGSLRMQFVKNWLPLFVLAWWGCEASVCFGGAGDLKGLSCDCWTGIVCWAMGAPGFLACGKQITFPEFHTIVHSFVGLVSFL